MNFDKNSLGRRGRINKVSARELLFAASSVAQREGSDAARVCARERGSRKRFSTTLVGYSPLTEPLLQSHFTTCQFATLLSLCDVFARSIAARIACCRLLWQRATSQFTYKYTSAKVKWGGIFIFVYRCDGGVPRRFCFSAVLIWSSLFFIYTHTVSESGAFLVKVDSPCDGVYSFLIFIRCEGKQAD